MRALLITGTDTGVGKTRVACDLAGRARDAGLRVGVMKPAETGCLEFDAALWPEDAHALKRAARSTIALDLICPYRYRSPLAPAVAADIDGLARVDFEALKAAFETICSANDLVVVEGAGGIRVPLTWEADYADLSLVLNLEVVLVVANRLGCLNAALLTLHYPRMRGLRVLGYVLNDIEPVRSEAATTNGLALQRLTSAVCIDHVHRDGHSSNEGVASLIGR